MANRTLNQITDHVHEVSSPRVAEMEKLLENIYRSVNIALVNELARLCDRMGGISLWEVIEAASTKPFGFMPFFPGPGLGGHCIPIDPYYLSWLARKYDFETNFITLSARINEDMPYYVVEAILRGIARQKVRMAESSVLILGAAFKKDVGDVRHSPALKIIELLSKRGIGTILFHDPLVNSISVRKGEGTVEMRSVSLTPDLVTKQEVVVIVTDHSEVDYELIAEHSNLIVDTRNAMHGVQVEPDRIMLLGGGQF